MRAISPLAAQHFHLQSALPRRMQTTAMSASLRSMVEHALPSRLLKAQPFDIHFQCSVVVEVQTMFSTVQKGDLQCAAYCARLTLLELVEELFE